MDGEKSFRDPLQIKSKGNGLCTISRPWSPPPPKNPTLPPQENVRPKSPLHVSVIRVAPPPATAHLYVLPSHHTPTTYASSPEIQKRRFVVVFCSLHASFFFQLTKTSKRLDMLKACSISCMNKKTKNEQKEQKHEEKNMKRLLCRIILPISPKI